VQHAGGIWWVNLLQNVNFLKQNLKAEIQQKGTNSEKQILTEGIQLSYLT
jgi:hypothetical protein